MDLPERKLEPLARSRVPRLLAEALGVKASAVHVRSTPDKGFDFTVSFEGRLLLVQVLGRVDRARLLSRWGQVRKAGRNKSQIPVVAVPFMTDPAQALCDELQINWVDLSGNASIRAPGLRVHIRGNPNLYARPGRPSSAFEARGSRLVRLLLLRPGRDWSVRECARLTELDPGYTSRVVRRLQEDELLAHEGRRFRVRDPALLLEAWRDSADFSKHQILRGHVPARSGEELLRLLTKRLDELQLGHAATGLGAAWLYDHFAMFRLATLYLRGWPTPAQLEHLHFREESSGANAWLAIPNDGGVFMGQRPVDGIPCVDPVQVYVDLKGHPERASEASEHLRSNPILLGGGPGPQTPDR
jgi:hypothetical protein